MLCGFMGEGLTELRGLLFSHVPRTDEREYETICFNSVIQQEVLTFIVYVNVYTDIPS
jgi:hypothetical protein